MLEELNVELDDLKISTIKNHNLYEKNNDLYLNIHLKDDSLINIVFHNVRSYFYQDFDGVNDIELNKFSPNLDFISYYKNGFAMFSSIDLSNLDKSNVSVPKFVINLIDSNILIDAESIEVNGKLYELKIYN
ncbi:MAG: YxiG family protein [Bacillota bacterium]